MKIIFLILYAIDIFMLALSIESAVKYFISKNYFRFGLEVGVSIAFILSMISLAF